MDGAKIKYLHIFLLCAFALAQPLFDLLGKNADFFVARHSEPGEIVLLVLVLSVLTPLLVSLVIWLAGRIHRGLQLGLTAFVLVVLVAAIFLPVFSRFSGSYLAPTLAVVCGILACYTWFKFKNSRTFLNWLSPAVLIFPVLFLLGSDIRQLLTSGNAAYLDHSVISEAQDKSSLPPIVMLVFDEFPLLSLLDQDENIDIARFPNIAQLAADAHWFRKATTVSEDTLSAIPAILTGRYPSEYLLATSTGYPENLFTLLGHFYGMRVTEPVTQLCPSHLCPRLTDETGLTARMRGMMSDVGIIYLHFLLPETYKRTLPPIDHAWKNFRQQEVVLKDNKSVHDIAIQQIHNDRKQEFLKFIGSILPADHPEFFYLHSMLPHQPYDYLPSGKFHGVGTKEYGLNKSLWTDSTKTVRQAWQRELLQVGFVDFLMGELIHHLKQHELYEKSLIVMVSDHGASFRPGDAHRPVTPTNYHDIMSVPLIIKLPDQKKGRVQDENAETVDIVPTLLDTLGIRTSWALDGKSLLKPASIDREDKIFFHQHVNQKLTTSIDDFTRVRLEALQHKATLFKQDDGLVGGLEESTEANATVSFDQQDFLKHISQDDEFIPAHITGQFFWQGSAPVFESLAVAINGKMVGLADVYEQTENSAKLSIMIPEHVLNLGANNVSAYFVAKNAQGRSHFARLKASDDKLADGNIFQLVENGVREEIVTPGGVSIPVDENGIKGWVDRVDIRGNVLKFSGWAADTNSLKPADTIVIFANGEFFHAGSPNFKRQDVARHLKSDAFLQSGFDFDFPAASLEDFDQDDVKIYALAGTTSAVLLSGGNAD